VILAGERDTVATLLGFTVALIAAAANRFCCFVSGAPDEGAPDEAATAFRFWRYDH
jgi:hypothetical protein